MKQYPVQYTFRGFVDEMGRMQCRNPYPDSNDEEMDDESDDEYEWPRPEFFAYRSFLSAWLEYVSVRGAPGAARCYACVFTSESATVPCEQGWDFDDEKNWDALDFADDEHRFEWADMRNPREGWWETIQLDEVSNTLYLTDCGEFPVRSGLKKFLSTRCSSKWLREIVAPHFRSNYLWLRHLVDKWVFGSKCGRNLFGSVELMLRLRDEYDDHSKAWLKSNDALLYSDFYLGKMGFGVRRGAAVPCDTRIRLDEIVGVATPTNGLLIEFWRESAEAQEQRTDVRYHAQSERLKILHMINYDYEQEKLSLQKTEFFLNLGLMRC